MKALLALTFLGLLIAGNEAKVFSKCELARVMKRHGLDGYDGYSLGNWVCLAYYASSYNTRAMGPKTSDGNREYGIFQVSSRWWCSNGHSPSANGCKSSCSAFIDDNIADDIKCVKRIVRDPNRMNAWLGGGTNTDGTCFLTPLNCSPYELQGTMEEILQRKKSLKMD